MYCCCSKCIVQLLFEADYKYAYRPAPSGAADAGTAERPLRTIRSCLHILPTNAHRTGRNVDHLAGFAEKPTEKPTERCSVSVSVFFGFFKKRPKPTDFLVRNRKTDREISTFGSQSCVTWCYVWFELRQRIISSGRHAFLCLFIFTGR